MQKTLVANDLEVWKDLPDYENYYSISNLGRFYSKRYNKLIKTNCNCLKRYKKVILTSEYGTKEYKLLHRLVAQTFIPNINNYKCINHIDGNKHNNNISNLEWCSYSYNNKHSYKMKLNNRVSLYKPVECFDFYGNTIGKYKSISDCAKTLNLDASTISKVCNQKIRSTKGYIIKYINY